MEAQIVLSHGPNGAHPPTRALTGPSPIRGSTFDQVHEVVATRAARMRPDATVHVSDLVFTPEGHVVVPGVGPHALTSLAKRQLAGMVGIRWERWFQSASPDERAEELNRRLKRTPGERKLRAWADTTGATAGTLRAILPPGYEPIDDLRIFESLRSNMGSLSASTCSSASRPERRRASTPPCSATRAVLRGDDLVPGWSLRTSEIGQAPLSIDDYWLRLVCMNGLMVAVGGKRSLYRRHRAIDDDQLGAAFVLALGRLPGRFERALELMASPWTRWSSTPTYWLPTPSTASRAPSSRRSSEPPSPRRPSRASASSTSSPASPTRRTTDPEVRFAMESAAGTLLAA
jgi:hypothetical protein